MPAAPVTFAANSTRLPSVSCKVAYQRWSRPPQTARWRVRPRGRNWRRYPLSPPKTSRLEPRRRVPVRPPPPPHPFPPLPHQDRAGPAAARLQIEGIRVCHWCRLQRPHVSVVRDNGGSSFQQSGRAAANRPRCWEWQRYDQQHHRLLPPLHCPSAGHERCPGPPTSAQRPRPRGPPPRKRRRRQLFPQRRRRPLLAPLEAAARLQRQWLRRRDGDSGNYHRPTGRAALAVVRAAAVTSVAAERRRPHLRCHHSARRVTVPKAFPHDTRPPPTTMARATPLPLWSVSEVASSTCGARHWRNRRRRGLPPPAPLSSPCGSQHPGPRHSTATCPLPHPP